MKTTSELVIGDRVLYGGAPGVVVVVNERTAVCELTDSGPELPRVEFWRDTGRPAWRRSSVRVVPASERDYAAAIETRRRSRLLEIVTGVDWLHVPTTTLAAVAAALDAAAHPTIAR